MADADIRPAVDGRSRAAVFGMQKPFHACWYPIALSSEVASGAVISVPFLGGRVVAYRTEGGTVYVKSAFCRHLGADLSKGEVIGDQLRCAFHHWSYDGNGYCSHIPAGDPPPRAARLFSFPTVESLGIIWAFNGAEATYPVPSFGDGPVAVDTFRNPVPMRVAGDTVILNSFDLQHFKAVHKMDMKVDRAGAVREPYRYHYTVDAVTPEFGAIRQDRILWGVGTITIKSARNGRDIYLLHALCPNEEKYSSGFLVNALGPDPSGKVDPEADRAILETMRGYSLRLVAEDAPIFDTIRFERGCLTRSDEFLVFGMDYISSFPEHNPAAGLID